MNILFRLLMVILVFRLTVYPVIGDTSPDIYKVPASLWESQTGKIDFAITLITTEGKDKSESMMKIYLKNTSASVQALIVSGTDRGFSFFTIDSNGVKHRLHDRVPVHKNDNLLNAQELAQERLQEMQSRSESTHLDEISPGAIISRTIAISPVELELIKTNLLQCSFSMIDPNTTQSYHIDSLPKRLTETIIPKPSK